MHRVHLGNLSARLWSASCKGPWRSHPNGGDAIWLSFCTVHIHWSHPGSSGCEVWPDTDQSNVWLNLRYTVSAVFILLGLCNFQFSEKNSCYLGKTFSVSQCLHLGITAFLPKFLQIVSWPAQGWLMEMMLDSSIILQFLKTFFRKSWPISVFQLLSHLLSMILQRLQIVIQ